VDDSGGGLDDEWLRVQAGAESEVGAFIGDG
jgi:hypothetical protein